MISVKQHQGRYLVSFKGHKRQFNDYINKIMSIDNKERDFEHNCWSFDESTMQQVYQLFEKKVSKPVELVMKKDKVDVKKIVDYEHIGKSMKLTPYDYQKEAIKFCLDAKEALLVYPCGSGKTPIGIGAYLEAKKQGIIDGPGMIVVKATLKMQWLKEIEKFSDLKAIIIQTLADISSSVQNKIKRREAKILKLEKHSEYEKEIKILKSEILQLKKETREIFKSQFKEDIDLFVLNYETLRDSQVRAQLHKRRLKFVMADEVHYIKSPGAKRSKSLYEFCDIPIKIGATATPVSKDPEDIFGIYSFVKPTLFPNWKSFSQLYIKYAGYGRKIGGKNLSSLNEKISPHLLWKAKEDISDQLPDLIVIPRHCDLEPEQQEMHTKIMETLDELKAKQISIMAGLKSEKEAKINPELMRLEALILAHQTFAQQLANSEELLQVSDSEMSKEFITGCHSNKLDLLVDVVDEILDSGEKVAIYSRFKKMQDVIVKRFAKEFPKAKIAYIHGSLNDKQRYAEVYDKFRDKDEYKILLCTDAGAEGLNLSRCKYLIEYDLAESYAIQTQRHGRVERADSTHENVFVYQLICSDSWDEIQKKIIEKKEGYDAAIIRSI